MVLPGIRVPPMEAFEELAVYTGILFHPGILPKPCKQGRFTAQMQGDAFLSQMIGHSLNHTLFVFEGRVSKGNKGVALGR